VKHRIGGSPPLPASLLNRAPPGTGVRWVASGRDGYLLICRGAPVRRWLLPDFLCGVVPRTLAAAGARVSAYRAGGLARIPAAERRRSVVVLLWDVDRGPARPDVIAAQDAPLVVEDRCVWAGLPWHLPDLTPSHVAVGSCRKWLGTGDGGWVVARGTELGRRCADPEVSHVVAVAAAALLRRLRTVRELSSLEAANIACAELAEAALGIPTRPRAMSQLGTALLSAAGRQDDARRSRSQLAGHIFGLLGSSDRPRPGATGVRVASPRRDALRRSLSSSGVYAPVHWPDGAWSGSAAARALAATTLTLPAPSDLSEHEERDYLRLLSAAIKRFGVRAAPLAPSK
jgi:hypothetical protein